MNQQRSLTTREAARYCNVSEQYLRISRCQTASRHRCAPGPRFVRIGRRVRYLLDDLDSWLEENRADATRALGENSDRALGLSALFPRIRMLLDEVLLEVDELIPPGEDSATPDRAHMAKIAVRLDQTVRQCLEMLPPEFLTGASEDLQ